MGRFRILFESESKRVFTGFKEYKKNELNKLFKRYGKDFKKILNTKTREITATQFIEKIKKEWFDIIFNLAGEGKFMDWQTLNDVWNLDAKRGGYFYRLFHDVPDGKFDTKWVVPNKGTTAKGWKDRAEKYKWGK